MKIIWRAITVAFLVTIFAVIWHEYKSLGCGFTNIGFKKGIFYDRTRERSLQYLLWYPAAHTIGAKTQEGPWARAPVARDAPIDLQREKYPLILLSHGFQGTPGDQSWIAESLVSKGYIVCGVKHPDMNPDTHIVSPLWHRPLDVSYVLSELLYSDFGTFIDQNQVGFVGFSMGALTGIWLSGGISNQFDQGTFYPTKDFVNTFHYFKYLKEVRWENGFENFKKSYRDPRIKAIFLMAPSWSWVFSKEGLDKIKTPIHIVAPEEDTLIVTQANAERYARLIPKSKMYLFNGKMSHYVFLNSILDERIPEYDPTGEKSHLYENLPGISRDRVHEKTSNLAIEFFSSHLRQ